MESKGRLIVLAIAGVVVAFGAISVYNSVVGTSAVPVVETEAKNRVLVARRDLTPGTFVQVPQDVDWSNVPPTSITEENIVEGTVQIYNFNGAVVRRQLRAGDLISKNALMTSGEGGFMSAVLEPGYRAISVAVNPTSGNAGFISPGDRVDMIVTRKIRSEGKGADEQIVSETFVEDVRVLAVDQQLDNPENKAILAKTVTVEVTPKEAEQVAIAAELGKISLVLRSAGANVALQSAEPGAEMDASMENQASPAAGNHGTVLDTKRGIAPHIRVIRGDEVENVDIQ